MIICKCHKPFMQLKYSLVIKNYGVNIFSQQYNRREKYFWMTMSLLTL